MFKPIILTGLLLVAAPVLAQPAPNAGTPAPAAAQPKKDTDRIICETQTQIGSRLASKRVCMTAAQWKEHQQQVHDQLDQTHVNVESSPGPG